MEDFRGQILMETSYSMVILVLIVLLCQLQQRILQPWVISLKFMAVPDLSLTNSRSLFEIQSRVNQDHTVAEDFMEVLLMLPLLQKNMATVSWLALLVLIVTTSIHLYLRGNVLKIESYNWLHLKIS